MGLRRSFDVWERDGWRCGYCGQEIVYDREHRQGGLKKPRSNSATVDHLVLRSDGGTRSMDNLVASCWSCNHDRGNLTVREFIFGGATQHAARACRRLHQRIKITGDINYALVNPLNMVEQL